VSAHAAGARTPRAGTPLTGAWLQRLRQRAFRAAPADRESVVLRHSRIYILPTRRGYALIATLIVMLLTSLNYALSLGLAVTFLLSGLVSAALLHTFRNLAGIEIKPLAASDSFAGEPMTFALSLAARAFGRRSIRVAATGAAALASIAGGDARTVTLAVQTRDRGHVALGRVTLSSDYPLGLWRGWAYVHFPLTGIAYPAPEAHAPPLPGGARDADGRNAGRGDDAELAGLREYQRGDPLRGAGWFSKSFEGAGAHGPLVLSFAALPAHLSTEAKLSRLCAWVLAAERATRPFALSLPGKALPPGLSVEHRRAALTALALFPHLA
jgi:uncharacterized protein (DUF58 family)